MHLLLLVLLASDGGMPALSWSPLELRATPVPLRPDGGTQLGALTFRGAVDLTSDAGTFGGLSGLRWWNGKLYAVADKRGTLFRFTPRHDAKGTLVGLEPGAESVAIDVGDAESVEFTDRALLISNEDDTTLSSFPLEGPRIGATATRLPLPSDGWGLGRNKGFEAVAVAKDCALLFAELAGTGFVGPPAKVHTAAPNLRALPWPPEFSPTDAVWSTPGRAAWVVLRKFDGLVHVALARLTLEGCVPEGLKVELVAQWEAPLLVDNFEAVALAPADRGVTLYLLSDDNFRRVGPQRTLLLEFSTTGP